jgi:4a-hydroxytetrahydrobiopterin dehydratase
MTDTLSVRQFQEATGTEDWCVLSEGALAYFRTGSFAAGARLVEAIGGLPGLDDRHPDVDLRHDGVTVRLLTATDDWYGMTTRDVILARQISALAREQGLTADPSSMQTIEPIVIDALDIPRVMPFWQALLGYERRADSPHEDLIDPRRRAPGVWFQQMDAPRPQRNRMHVAVWVPPELAEARVAAAVAAGGTLVTDAYAPSWWVLADPEGNEADVATTVGRE